MGYWEWGFRDINYHMTFTSWSLVQLLWQILTYVPDWKDDAGLSVVPTHRGSCFTVEWQTLVPLHLQWIQTVASFSGCHPLAGCSINSVSDGKLGGGQGQKLYWRTTIQTFKNSTLEHLNSTTIATNKMVKWCTFYNYLFRLEGWTATLNESQIL